MAKLNLSLADVKVSTGSGNGFSIVPTGKYTVVVGSADVGTTKNGSSLIVGYAIVKGEHEGKLIKEFLNIVNPSAEAQRISLERLATIAWATNAPMKGGVLNDTDDLVGKEQFEISVEQVDDGEYKNMKIKAVICTRDLTVKEAVKEPATKASKPWEKK
jgi:hypothetical protein